MIRSAFRISRWMGGHILTSSSSILSSSYVLLAPRSRDYIKVNNYRWQSGDINGRSNNTNNSITARSYGDKSGRGQKKTLKADDRSDYLDVTVETQITPTILLALEDLGLRSIQFRYYIVHILNYYK